MRDQTVPVWELKLIVQNWHEDDLDEKRDDDRDSDDELEEHDQKLLDLVRD